MPIRGIILDIDGTLVESNDAHAQAWVKALEEFSYTVPVETVRPLIGMGGDKLLPKVAGINADSPRGKQISKRRAAIFRARFLPHLRSCRGSEELLQLLDKRGFQLGVASSAKKDESDQLLKICGADRFIEGAASSDDASSKPDPDIVLAALEKMGLPPDQVTLLGDTPYDTESARRAGVAMIAVRCGGWSDAKLRADEVYDDPLDLANRLDQSPLLNSAPDQAR